MNNYLIIFLFFGLPSIILVYILVFYGNYKNNWTKPYRVNKFLYSKRNKGVFSKKRLNNKSRKKGKRNHSVISMKCFKIGCGHVIYEKNLCRNHFDLSLIKDI